MGGAAASSLAINSRDAAFGALLALDNIVERIVLDAEKQENDNRPSNAMRLMPHVARVPMRKFRSLWPVWSHI